MKILFLGTAAGKPSNHRNVTSIAVILENTEFILIDCGEATQHQLMKSTLRYNKLGSIFITHMHGDHIFGLPGLLCSLNEIRSETLSICGPKGLKSYIESSLNFTKLNYKIHVTEFTESYGKAAKITSGNYLYEVDFCKVLHSVTCFAYKIKQSRNLLKIDKTKIDIPINYYRKELEELGFEPAEQIISTLKSNITITMEDGFIFDVKDYSYKEPPFELIIALDNYDSKHMISVFKSCHALIHECTYAIFPNEKEGERAKITKTALSHWHSTNVMAVETAKLLKAKTLMLTHFSNRYDFDDEEKIVAGCIKYAENKSMQIFCARDFSEFCICNK